MLVLGPCEIDHGDGRRGPELSAVQRKVLVRLAVSRPAAVELDDLIDAVWGDSPPPTAKTSLHNQISRIRRQHGAATIRTAPNGYLLAVGTDADEAAEALRRVEMLVLEGEDLEAHRAADEAIGLFRGVPFEELDDELAHRVRFDELHRSLETARLDTAIRAGLTSWAVPEAERLVAVTPHDEQRWALLIRALGAAGRRGDALGAFDRARRLLAIELGLAPGDELRAAEASVLASAPSTSRRRRLPTVGATDRVARVVDAVAAGASVLLIGETGIGKSRTLQEVQLELSRRGLLVTGALFPLHPSSATATLRELVDELGADMDPRLPPVVAFERALDAAVDGERRVAVCVDDLDRAGPTSLSALRAADALGQVVIVATATETPASWSPAVRLDLEPLEHAAVADLAAEVLDADPDDDEVRWLHTMSGGNPMLVEHLLDEMATRTSIDALEPSSELRALVRRRLDHLDASSRIALEVASVCGPVVDAALLRALAPSAGIEGSLAASLLVEAPSTVGQSDRPDRARPPSTALAFRHGAVRQIVYDDLAPGHRTELHHAVARVLSDSGAPAGTVAAHAVAAADLDLEAAIDWASAAGEDATRLGAHAEAAGWHGQVAALADRHQPTRHVSARIAEADALRMSGSVLQEPALFQAAAAATELGDPDLIADAAFALLQLGATTESGSLHEQAIAVADAALAVVSDPDRWARIAGAASLAHSMTGAPGRCRDLFLDAIACTTSDRTRREILPFAFLAIGHPSDLVLREQVTDELLERGAAADDPVALFEGHQLAASVAMQRADGERLRRSVVHLEELIVRLGDVGRRWALLYHRAAIQHLDGDLDAAEATSEAALELFAPTSPSRALATHGGQLLPIRLAQGRYGELRDVFESLVDDQPGVPAWSAALALAVAPDDPARATQLAIAALDGVEDDFTWLAAHLIGGRAAAATGDGAATDRYVRALEPWSGLVCWQGTCSYGPVDAVLAQLHAACGRDEQARQLVDRALEQTRTLGAPVFDAELHQLRDRLGQERG